MLLTGKVLKYGDNINTDVIIPGKYTKTLDLNILTTHVMEDLDPFFRRKLRPGDFVVAGRNFGCGSSREQAPVALKHAGVSCIAAISFARIFYRNAVNIGLPLIECDTSLIDEGDILEYSLGGSQLRNITRNSILTLVPLPQIMIEILKEGGLVPFIRSRKGYTVQS